MNAIIYKEIRTFLFSPKLFLFVALFTFMSGFIFLSLIEQFNPLVQRAAMVPNAPVSLNEQVLTPHLSALRILLLFFVPILTMRSFAGEREQKTLPLLLAAPISTAAIVVGKFAVLLTAISLFLTVQLVFPISLGTVATLELTPAIVGVFGLILLSSLYVAIGVALSAFCESQTVAGVLTFLALFFLHSVDAFSPEFGGKLATVVRLFSPTTHLESLLQGVLKSSALFFFIGLSSLLLVVAHERLELERGQ